MCLLNKVEGSKPARPSPRRAMLRMARHEFKTTLLDKALELTTCCFYACAVLDRQRLGLLLPPPGRGNSLDCLSRASLFPRRQFSTSSAPPPASINSETKSTTPEEKSVQVPDPRLEEPAEEYRTTFNSTRRVRKAVWDAAPDVFERLSPYLDSHKSPCFRDAQRPSQIKCLPYFSITGVSKCGTTDIYNKMIKLPGFQRVRIKGPHFWDQDHRTTTEYLALYDKLAIRTQDVACDASTATFSISPFGVRCGGCGRAKGRGNEALRPEHAICETTPIKSRNFFRPRRVRESRTCRVPRRHATSVPSFPAPASSHRAGASAPLQRSPLAQGVDGRGSQSGAATEQGRGHGPKPRGPHVLWYVGGGGLRGKTR